MKLISRVTNRDVGHLTFTLADARKRPQSENFLEGFPWLSVSGVPLLGWFCCACVPLHVIGLCRSTNRARDTRPSNSSNGLTTID